MDSQEIEVIFKSLKPLCVDIAQNQFNSTLLHRLKVEILKTESTDVEIWRCLFDYIVFPLRLYFRRANSPSIIATANVENCLITVFDIFRILIDRCRGDFNRFELLISLLAESFLLINNPPGSDEIVGSNKLINSVVDFAAILIKICVDSKNSSIDNGNRNFCKKLLENQSILAQIVYALLRCLKKSGLNLKTTLIDDDSERQLQICILRCLSIIFSLDDSVCAAFLPGAASALVDFILNLCSTTISARDQFINECLEIWTKLILSANSISTNSNSYTEEWRRNSGLQLSNHFDRLTSILISHQSSSVRRILFETSLKFLTSIDQNSKSILGDCHKRSLEILAASVADDQLNIDSKSISKSINRDYGTLLEKMLISISWRLPRSSKSILSHQQRIDWRCLLGYLRLLGSDGVSNFLLIDENKEAIFLGLIQSLEFGPIVEEIKPISDVVEEKSSPDRRRIRLTSPSDSSAQEIVSLICDQLSKMEEIDILFDYFYQMISRSETNRRQSIFILNTIFSIRRDDGLSINSDILFSLIDFDLDRLRSPDLLSNVEAALILENLGRCALRLKSDFQSILVAAFYVVLTLIRYSDYKDFVWSTLFDFATALNFRNISEMVAANVDYLSSSLTLRLRRYSLYPDSALILASIFDLLSWESIGTFRGCISETLKAIDYFSSYPDRRKSIADLLTVLERFCVFVIENGPAADAKEKRENRLSIGDQNDRSSESENENQKSPPPPWHILLIVDILTRIRSWIFADGIPTRLASLRVLNVGLKALSNDEDNLLPIIHQNWPSTMARLGDILENEQDERMIVVSSLAFEITTTMAAVGKNFVCRRFCDEAWPKIKSILRRYLPVSKKASALIYGQCPSFRLQLSILENLSNVCQQIEATKEFSKEVIVVCRWYESNDVLPALKNQAENCSKNLERICNH